jgi:hypothetical protein
MLPSNYKNFKIPYANRLQILKNIDTEPYIIKISQNLIERPLLKCYLVSYYECDTMYYVTQDITLRNFSYYVIGNGYINSQIFKNDVDNTWDIEITTTRQIYLQNLEIEQDVFDDEEYWFNNLMYPPINIPPNCEDFERRIIQKNSNIVPLDQ